MHYKAHYARVRKLQKASIGELAKHLDKGFSETSRTKLEAMGEGNPSNSQGYDLAEKSLKHLFEKVGKEAAVVKAVSAIRWNDDRLWVIFKMFSLGYGEFHSPSKLGPVAKALFPVLLAKIEKGGGRDKLAKVLVRAGIIDKQLVAGAGPTLPKQLPTSKTEALALRETWQLGPKDLEIGKPATAAQLKSLEKMLGRKLPPDLRELLESCGSIGDRQFGPYRWIAQITEEIPFCIAEDEEMTDSDPTNAKRGYYDVRRFSPKKSGIGLGTEISGDRFFLALDAKSAAGLPPVIRYHHGMALTASVYARSLGEYVARLFAEAYSRREGFGVELRVIQDETLKVAAPPKKK